jgi:hypothetical protein
MHTEASARYTRYNVPESGGRGAHPHMLGPCCTYYLDLRLGKDRSGTVFIWLRHRSRAWCTKIDVLLLLRSSPMRWASAWSQKATVGLGFCPAVGHEGRTVDPKCASKGSSSRVLHLCCGLWAQHSGPRARTLMSGRRGGLQVIVNGAWWPAG